MRLLAFAALFFLLYPQPVWSAPEPPTPTPGTVEAYLNARDWEAATAALEQIIASDPGNTTALYRLGLLAASSDPEAARSYLARAALNPEFAPHAAEIIAELDALTDEPDRAYANARLAMALVALEEWEMAEPALERALLLNPRYAEAMAYLGLVRTYHGENGLPLAQEAVSLAPENGMVRYALGRLYMLRENPVEAVPTLLQAAALEPENALIAAELGTAYRRWGAPEDAAYWLRRATDLDRNNPRFWEARAAFYADMAYKLEEEGLTVINTAVQRMPTDADLRVSLGWALYLTDEPTAALQEMETAVSLAPENARAMFYYGVLLEVNGQAGRAAEAYLTVLQLAPESRFAPMARRGLDRLNPPP